MIHFELVVNDGDFSIRVNGSVHLETEDILWGLIRGFDDKFPEEGSFFFRAFLKSEAGDFQGGGVNLLVVISVEFVFQNPLGLFVFFDIFSERGADKSVLEPPIGSFHFTFGLVGKTGHKPISHYNA